MSVVPAFASGLDARPAIERFFMANGQPTVDAVVNLTGFSLVGGPAYNDADAAVTMLKRLDVPYIAAHPVEFQTLEQWSEGATGLTPLEATMMVAIPSWTAPSARLCSAVARARRTARCGRCAPARNASTRSPPRSPSWSRCAARRARSASWRSCCSTFRPIPDRPVPRPSCPSGPRFMPR
jgi:hypothetical protein